MSVCVPDLFAKKVRSYKFVRFVLCVRAFISDFNSHFLNLSDSFPMLAQAVFTVVVLQHTMYDDRYLLDDRYSVWYAYAHG